MARHKFFLGAMVFLGVLVTSTSIFAQVYGARLGGRRGGEITFEPKGPGVLLDALDPAVKKWYVPQELFMEYQWKQWEYTNYARSPYERYVDIALEGDYLYDIYGNFVTRGWLIYNWRQMHPLDNGSSLYRDRRFFDWFSGILIASDSKGQYHSSLMVGHKIRTTLTPMTFSKPAFDGIQWDFLSDKYAATILASRINQPGSGDVPNDMTDATILMGGRATAQVGDFVKVGATYVNSHMSQSVAQSLGWKGNPLRGVLTGPQNEKSASMIIIRLSDDSPEDGEAGTAFFSENIIITDTKGNTIDGKQLGLHSPEWPSQEGGFRREGYWTADGDEQIVLTYDFTSDAYKARGPDPSEIQKVTFELLVSNDYRIDVTSDRQTDVADVPVMLSDGIPEWTIRAPGNIKDNSNQGIVRFDYGLPTASEVYGFTVEVNDVLGFDLYGEFDFSRRYKQYPNLNIKLGKHHTSVGQSTAWMVNVSKRAHPWFFFGEAFSMDDDYSTASYVSAFRAGRHGFVDYSSDEYNIYEFVDDNDDQDRWPDWRRQGGIHDPAVFPGWDENNDFISDFNQNDSEKSPNLIPDYDEPFLRYSCDRPEFLFGIDMNNNGWIDRFENDEQPDYPYKRDHRGYNVYFGGHIIPGVRLTVGQEREWLLSEDKRNLTTYGLFTFDKDYTWLGRLRIFENLRMAKDNIPDDLFQWPPNISKQSPQMVKVLDPLPAPNTWVNTAYIGFDYTRIRDLNIINKIKYESYDQRRKQPRLRDHSSFFGIINKADYTLRLGDLWVEPRIKSEFRRHRPFLRLRPEDKPSVLNVDRKEHTLTSSVILKFPVLHTTAVQAGVEFTHFEQLREDGSGLPLFPAVLDPDYNEWVYAVQLSNVMDYLGYRITAQVGLEMGRRTALGETETESTTFVTIFAGIE